MASKKKSNKKSSKKAAKADSRQASKGSAKADLRKTKKAKKPAQAKRGGASAKKRPAAAKRKPSPPSRAKKAKGGKPKPSKRASEAPRKRAARRAAAPTRKKKAAPRAAAPAKKKKAARRAAPAAKKKSASRRAAVPAKKKAKRAAGGPQSERRATKKARRAAASSKKKAARRKASRALGGRRSAAPRSKRLLLKRKAVRRAAAPPKRKAARRSAVAETARASGAKKARRLAAKVGAGRSAASARKEKAAAPALRKRDVREAAKVSVRPSAPPASTPPPSRPRKALAGSDQELRPTLKKTGGAAQELRSTSKKGQRLDGPSPAPGAGRRASTVPPRVISREPPRTPPQIVSFPIPAIAAVKRPTIEERSAAIETRLNAQTEDFRRRYIDSFDMSWIYHDSALEGVVYTFEELRAALSGQGMPVTDSSIQPTCDDIRRHKEAIDFVRDFATKKRLPVTVDIIKKIYLILRPEEGDVKTVKYRKDVPQHRLYFHEYAPPDKIAYKVRQIVDWLTDPETRKTRNGIRIAARAHYDLLRVFPFPTESGKVARLFMNLLLLRSGLPPSIIHSTERQRYYEALKGSATTVLSMVQESVENALSSVEKLLDEHETRTRAFVS